MDQLGECFSLAPQMRVEVGTAFWIGIERLRDKLGLDLRRGHGSTKPIDQLRDGFLRRFGRRHHAEPDVGLEIPVAGFRDRGQIGQRLDACLLYTSRCV